MDTKGAKLIEGLTNGEITHNASSSEAVRFFFLQCDMDIPEAVGTLASAGLMAQEDVSAAPDRPQLKFRGYRMIPPTEANQEATFDESRYLFEDLSMDNG